MDRRKFLAGSAAIGTTAASLGAASPAFAAACEDQLYSPAKPANRLIYPEKPGEAPTPVNLEFPPGTARRYYY